MTRYVTPGGGTTWIGDESPDSTLRSSEMEERFALYRLCPNGDHDLVATCGTPEAVGVALVTLGREGEWEGCAFGVLDTLGAKNQKWIIRPWLPSPKNLSDAGRVLATARHRDIIK